MVHFQAVAQFVDYHIVNNMAGDQHQQAVEIEIALAGAAAPAAALIADGDAPVGHAHDGGKMPHPFGDDGQRLLGQCFSEEAKLIRESELFPFFDAPCLSWEEGVRKPDPAIYRTCLRRLGIAPENCLYVGDGGSFELETARSLGLQAVQATWYRQAAFEHKQAALRPDFPQPGDPMEVLDFLKGECL